MATIESDLSLKGYPLYDTTLRDAKFSGLHDAATKRVDSYKSNDGLFAKIDTNDAMTNGQGKRVN